MSALELPAVARRRPGRPLGWWGMLMFIAGEATLLAVMTATYFYLRFKNLQWPPRAVPEPKLVVPLLLLALLLASSGPIELARRAGRNAQLGRVRVFLTSALLVQAVYLGIQVHEYRSDLRHFAPTGNAYGSIYYTLLGADHVHVGIGLVFDLWLLGKLARGLTRYRRNALEAIGLYWHAVNAITIVVTLTLLSPAL